MLVNNQELVADLALHAAKSGIEAIVRVSDNAPVGLQLPVMLSAMIIITSKIEEMVRILEDLEPDLAAKYLKACEEMRSTLNEAART